MTLPLTGAGPSAGGSYFAKVLNTQPGNLIGFWPQNELVGGIAIDYSGLGNDGAYVGVTLGQPGVPGMGWTCPLYDGANDGLNIFSAGFGAAYDHADGSFLEWCKVLNVGVWTDVAFRVITRLILGVGGNYFIILKINGANAVDYYYQAGGILESTGKLDCFSTDWMTFGATWSKTGAGFQAYYNGAPQGALQAIAGVPAGGPTANETNIGRAAVWGGDHWNGWIGPAMFWNTALTAAEMANLSVV